MSVEYSSVFDESDLPEFMLWKATNSGMSILSFGFHSLSKDALVAACKLIWPDLLLKDGGVFLAANFDQNAFDQWKRELGNEMRMIEKVMNHCHVCDLVLAGQQMNASNRKRFGELLAAVWKCRLATAFPKRRFTIDSVEDKESEDFLITFYQSA